MANIIIYIVAYFVGLMISYIILFIIYAVLQLLVGKMLGYDFRYLVLYVIHIKKENDRITCKFTNPNLSALCGMYKHGASDAVSVLYNMLPAAAALLLSVVCAMHLHCLNAGIFFAAVADCCIFWSMVCIFFSLSLAKNYFSDSPKAVLWRKSKEISDMLIDGIRPREIHMDLSVPEIKKYDFSELNYLLFCYYHCLDSGDLNKLEPYISVFEHNMPNIYSHYYNRFLYEIVFYYSFVLRDVESAQNIITNMNGEIEADKDINGRRVYAYFLYYTGKGCGKALETAKEGIANASSFPEKGVAEMETQILNNLINTINKETPA